MMRPHGAGSARRGLLLAALLAGGLALSACSSVDKPKPTVLEAFTPRIAGKQVWRTKVGGPLPGGVMAVARDRVVVATRDGEVVSLDVQTGAERERLDLHAKLSAGVGSDGRFHAVVTEANELVAIEAGRERWRMRLASRVVTAPLVAGDRVFVQGVDRAIEAYDVHDGRKLWQLQRQGDALALAQPGVLAAYKDTLLVGFGSKLLGVDPLLGTVRSELSLASPRGTNEVERLSDLVGPAGRTGDTFCARSFQSAVACVNAERATLLWSRSIGGYNGLAADIDYVYAADASDRITAWKRATGDTAWTSERLRYRELSAPMALGGAVAFGDVEGQIHFLSRDKGETLLRLPTDGSPIAVPLVRAGLTLLAHTRAGGVFAFRPE
jgi:outer membrane assembly lipoprotein YfgL